MEFGKLLVKLRKERGYLQKEVADYLNVTVATVSNYEKDIHAPDLDTLVRLADFYDVSTDYLLQRTRFKSSLRILNKRLYSDFTICDLINTALILDRHNVKSLQDYCDLLMLRNSRKLPK